MSLEQTLNENTMAIRDLIAVLKRQAYTEASQPAEIPGFDKPVEALGVETEVAVIDGKPVETTAASAADAKKGDTKAKPKAEPKVEQPAPQAEVSYADAADAVTKLSRAKGREAAVALLAKFNATKLPEVPADQYAAVRAEALQQVA